MKTTDEGLNNPDTGIATTPGEDRRTAKPAAGPAGPTPGPRWRVRIPDSRTKAPCSDPLVVEEDDGMPVATLDYINGDEYRVASLIAAAPELASALRELVRCSVSMSPSGVISSYEQREALRDARAALAKVDGR